MRQGRCEVPGYQAVDTALDQAASRLTPAFQNRALEAGWPEEAAARLRMVRTEHGTLALDYTGDKSEAEDLEYGTTSSGPRPILTTFVKPEGRQMMRQAMLESMDGFHDQIQRLFS